MAKPKCHTESREGSVAAGRQRSVVELRHETQTHGVSGGRGWLESERPEDTPAAVPLAQQAGTAEVHPLWATAKPCVWTTRMLTTLINGVEGGKWFRLFDKVFSERNLFTAFQQVARNDGASGVDHVSVDEFAQQIPENLWQLSDALKADTYRPQAIRRVHIPKPGTNETVSSGQKVGQYSGAR